MAKIWQLNEKPSVPDKIFSVKFTSDAIRYVNIGLSPTGDAVPGVPGALIVYIREDGNFDPVYEIYQGTERWVSQAYRTITFETAPTGELLTWLQANAVAQDQPTVTTTRVLYKGKKELTMAQFEALTSLDDAVDYDITDFPNGGITNAQMTAALGYSRLFEDGEIYVCSDNGTYTKGNWYQIKVEGGVKSWEDITPASGGSQDYQIVTAEPEDKSQGKIIYEKSSGVTLGKGVVNKTLVDEFYSSPSDFFGKFSEGTATASDIENYEYLLSSSSGFVIGYINIGSLPELTQYLASSSSFDLLFKVNNGEEQTDTLTLDSSGIFYVGTKLTVLRTNKLGETTGVSNDYYSVTIQDTEGFAVATTDTIQITKLKLGDVYINIDKGGSEGHFAIANLKIADGTNYNSLKDLVNEGMQEKLTAGTGVTIENNIISATAQDYVPIQSEAEPVALTWVINEKPDYQGEGILRVDIPLTAGGNSYTGIQIEPSVKYPSPTCIIRVLNGEEIYSGAWFEPKFADRTLTFGTAPKGELLTWLQANAVPQGSSTKTYAQVTNENGAVSIRVFENGDSDLQNLSITKNGVTINGKKPLTSVQPLYKHELEIAYSFLLPDSVEVNGPVMYHYLSNNGTQITNVSEIDDNFLLSGGIGKNTANTVLLLNITVIKAGSSITVEAVNASTMGYITGIIGTITDTVTQLI